MYSLSPALDYFPTRFIIKPHTTVLGGEASAYCMHSTAQGQEAMPKRIPSFAKPDIVQPFEVARDQRNRSIQRPSS